MAIEDDEIDPANDAGIPAQEPYEGDSAGVIPEQSTKNNDEVAKASAPKDWASRQKDLSRGMQETEDKVVGAVKPHLTPTEGEAEAYGQIGGAVSDVASGMAQRMGEGPGGKQIKEFVLSIPQYIDALKRLWHTDNILEKTTPKLIAEAMAALPETPEWQGFQPEAPKPLAPPPQQQAPQAQPGGGGGGDPRLTAGSPSMGHGDQDPTGRFSPEQLRGGGQGQQPQQQAQQQPRFPSGGAFPRRGDLPQIRHDERLDTAPGAVSSRNGFRVRQEMQGTPRHIFDAELAHGHKMALGNQRGQFDLKKVEGQNKGRADVATAQIAGRTANVGTQQEGANKRALYRGENAANIAGENRTAANERARAGEAGKTDRSIIMNDPKALRDPTRFEKARDALQPRPAPQQRPQATQGEGKAPSVAPPQGMKYQQNADGTRWRLVPIQ